MTKLTVKIVGNEGDSVLVKYSSENSAKSIDEYDAIAYNPKSMGYTTKEEFLAGIKPGLLTMVIARDNLENISEDIDLSDWADTEDKSEMEDLTIPEPSSNQVVNDNSEVII